MLAFDRLSRAAATPSDHTHICNNTAVTLPLNSGHQRYRTGATRAGAPGAIAASALPFLCSTASALAFLESSEAMSPTEATLVSTKEG